MHAQILSVDHAPPDLYAQVPFGAELIRRLPGPNDRDDYWLARLDRPLSYRSEGTQREIQYGILTARYVGQSNAPGVGRR